MLIAEVAVHVPSLPAASPTVGYAARLAARWQARLAGVHVLPPLDSLSLADDPQTLAALSHEQQRRRHEAIDAGTAFDALAKAAGAPSSRWSVAEGAVPESLAWAASGAELVVLAPDSDAESGRFEIDRAVIDARMPCLIIPPVAARREPTHSRVVVAWNGSVEAWRALVSALPFLRSASSIVLLDGSDPRSLRGIDLWEPPSAIDWLERHALQAQCVRIEPTSDRVGEMLLAKAEEQGADLIVMGAYGRSRFAEWLLGGVTRHMLRHATVPVLMHH
jgi:nucleotide-binding universal stress UspA family protein